VQLDRLQSKRRPPEAAPAAVERSLQTSVEDWLRLLTGAGGEVGTLLAAPPEEQERRGYLHTLREIAQQPYTWIETARNLAPRAAELRSALSHVTEAARPGLMALTGSGSSLYAGECLAPGLQSVLGIPVQAVASGELLTHPQGHLPGTAPCLVVSFARSGNSPESVAVLDSLRGTPSCRHLVITCNRHGRLAASGAGNPAVTTVVLDDKTCDRSLVMTSSFTNMVLAARLLAFTAEPKEYEAQTLRLARLGARLLLRHGDGLATIARSEFRSAVYLGSGGRYGSAREAALKMLEMTAGRVMTFPETYLGLRHGPMAAVDDQALVVCFLSEEGVARAYEADLVRELNRKGLGVRKVLVGTDVPADLVSPGDLVVDAPELGAVSDDDATLIDVLVGQLLAFFRCMATGLHPDSPSDDGVISRVVESFAIHRRT
jgi:tagatose-6-phosphate ketose/aldose isomerase